MPGHLAVRPTLRLRSDGGPPVTAQNVPPQRAPHCTVRCEATSYLRAQIGLPENSKSLCMELYTKILVVDFNSAGFVV